MCVSGISQAYGVATEGRLDHWKTILFQWCPIIDQQCRIMVPDDRPWWESEKANAALVAAAAIQCGHACMVETGTDKRGGKSAGDLWIKFNPAMGCCGSEQEFVEFKIDEIKDGAVPTEPFENAGKDVLKILESGTKIGGCFYRVSSKMPYLDISATVEHTKRKLKPDAIAWSFPECAKAIDSRSRYHLGVVLVLMVVG